MRVFFLLAVLSVSASAQTGTWLPSASGDGVALTSSHIVFDSDLLVGEEYTSLSNATVLQARLGGGGTLRFVADLPLAYAGVESSGDVFETDALVLGNPYLGIESGLGGAVVGLGMRVPLVETVIRYNRNNAFIAIPYGQSALSDRIGAFAVEATTIAGSVAGRYPVGEGFTARGRLVPQLVIPVVEGRDSRAFLGYDLGLEVIAGPALLTVGARGIGIVSEVARNEARFDHYIGLSVDVEAGGFRPGAYIEIPVLGDFRQAANAVVGVGVSTAL